MSISRAKGLNIDCFREYVMRLSTFCSVQLMTIWGTKLCLLQLKGRHCTPNITFWPISIKNIFATGMQQSFPILLLLLFHVAVKNTELLNVTMETQERLNVSHILFR